MDEPENDDQRDAMVTDLSQCVRQLLVARERLARRFAVANALSTTDFRALIHISESGARGSPLTAGGLRDLMNMSAGAATYVVDRLVATGQVEREADPSDRRKVLLRPTPEGVRITGEFVAAVEERNRAALSDVSMADLATTQRVICNLIDHIRAAEKTHVITPVARSAAVCGREAEAEVGGAAPSS